MFEQSFVHTTGTGRRSSTIAVSLLIQCLALAVLIVIPLIYFESLPKGQLSSMLLAPTPPPAPAPPPPAQVVRQVPAVTRHMIIQTPARVPAQVKTIREVEPPDVAVPPIGVPGGTGAGGEGNIAGAFGAINAAPPAPVAPRVERPKSQGPVPVGGKVEEANLLRQVVPVYPALARNARVYGVVRFNAVIGKDGTIRNLQLISGHPLLVKSAEDAVRQWVYRPTLLNGEPVDVITTIDVNFTLMR